MNLSAEGRRNNYPLDDYDVPLDELINRRQDGSYVSQIVPPDYVLEQGKKAELPQHPEFVAAVANTPGAELTPDGLRINLQRNQMPQQAGAQSIRTGVFYLPKGSKNARHYGTGAHGYGGTEKIEGETLIQKPLYVKGATGGKAPEAAYEQIKGKGAMKALESDIRNIVTDQHWMQKREHGLYEQHVAKFLERNGADPSLAWEIVRNSRKGNQLRYALSENIIAHTVRGAGYDSVLGFSRQRTGVPFISEVFDVRERSYPTQQGDFDVFDDE